MAFFETYPLTTSQQEIWFDQLLHPDVPLYNVAKAVQLEGTIDRVLFEQALEHVVARNDALRIVLVAGDELPTQRILDHLPLSIEYHDFSEHEDAEEQAQEWMRRETARPFQLHDHELFTFALLKVGEERSYWLAKYHHLITDGWAATLIVERVAATYNALCDGLPLPTDCWPSYLDFVRDDQAYMASERCQRDIAYWQAVYTTLPEPLFQNRHDMAPEEAARSHQSQRNLKRETCDPLRDFATEHRTTLNQIFLGTLYCYFVRIGQRDDLAIGLSSANRLTSAFRQTIGLFTNTIAPWYRFGTELTFLDLLRALQTEAERGAPHRRLPMSVLRRNTTLVQTERAQPFDVAVSYMSGASETPFGKTPATFQSIFTGYLPRGLTIYIEDQRAKGSVRLLFDGSATLFTPQDLERLGERLELLLGQVVRNPTTPIAQLPIIPQAEQQKILVEWNDTAAEYPQDKCVHQFFEDQVAKTPGAIAVETGHTRLTYSALDTQANRLAHHLRNLGVGPEMRVGLCVERSVDMLVGLLGILKAGAAYVPLDPSYPAERLCYMLADAGISILVTQSYLEARMPTFDATVVCLDATGTPWKDLPTTSPDSGVTAGNALYVIYTSGSTGRPKGVVVEHHSVVSLLRGLLAQQHRYAAPCKVLHRASLAFDVSVLELLGPLLAGGCVVMAPVDAGSAPAALASLIRRCCVTYADFPPALLAYLLEEPDFVHAESLRVVTVGGEALDSALAVRFTKECRAELWNDYGPTEATVEATAWPVARYRETKSVRIGRPLPGYRVYVVGRYGDLNPIGIPGELCIGGICVTRG
ncbi:MAG TPA: condensation domain-containing protein, partial [Polyangium sp.]|nr:condensation domain-containing protein [Polyangium sp.]